MSVKSVFAATTAIIFLSVTGAVAQSIDFGDDSSQYSSDGECDDRRFIGTGMASGLDTDDNFKDATDCKRLFDAGMINIVSEAAGRAATQCDEVEFGDNTSEWSNDGECDDPRFDGPGVDSIILMSDLLTDARDCRQQCNRGNAWLRTAAE